QIANAHDPFRAWRTPESREERRQQRAPIAQLFIPLHPAGKSEFFVQHQDRLAGAGGQHEKLVSSHPVSRFLNRFLRSHNYPRAYRYLVGLYCSSLPRIKCFVWWRRPAISPKSGATINGETTGLAGRRVPAPFLPKKQPCASGRGRTLRSE